MILQLQAGPPESHSLQEGPVRIGSGSDLLLAQLVVLGLTNTHGAVRSLGHLEPEKKFPDVSWRSVKYPGAEDDTGVRPDSSGRNKTGAPSEQSFLDLDWPTSLKQIFNAFRWAVILGYSDFGVG